jgi:O-acetyl-ADP-ribose deacetylase (regulator of RNase III)
MPSIQIVTGDLLHQEVEVIVNAWNRNFIPWWLLLPQGVSGAIKRSAGTEPFQSLRAYGTLAPGDAVVTTAGRLNYRAIIHVAALNMLWRSSEAIVRRCVRSALAIAETNGFASVAFPLIGSGIGGLLPSRVREAMVSEASSSLYSGHVVIVVLPGAR